LRVSGFLLRILKYFSHRGHWGHGEKYWKTGMMEYWNIGKTDGLARHSIVPLFSFGFSLYYSSAKALNFIMIFYES
jgi:hypothetical protein